MKGLLLKDLRLTMQQSKWFLIIVFMIVWFLCFQGADSAPFIMTYVSMMGGFFALNTISYDDFEHGTTFLMTLPITRRDYVKEKYVFAVLGILVLWGISTIVYLAFGLDLFQEIIITSMITLGLILSAEMFMLPIQLKYGSDRGRIVFVVLVMAVVLLGFILKGMVQNGRETELLFYRLWDAAATVDTWCYVVAAVVFLSIEMFVSYKISVRIIEKREY